MAVKTRNKKLIDQAALESLVRFGPQFDALDQLTKTAKDTYGATVGSADVQNASTQAAIKAARKPTAGIYDNAHVGQEALDTSLATGIAGLSGPGTDLVKAAALGEAHLASTHIAQEKMHALQDLTNRGIQAEAGRAQAVIAAGGRLHDDLAQIGQSRLSLAGQEGAFKSATIGDLLEQATGRRFTARQNELTRENQAKLNQQDNSTSRANTRDRVQAQKDAAAARAQQKAQDAKKGLLSNGVKLATPGEHGRARDTVQLAISEAKPYRKIGRQKLETLLTQGAAAETKKNADGTTSKLAAIPKVGELYASVALDILYNGRVSAKNRKLLNARGLTVKGMGFRGPMTAAERKRARQQQKLAQQAAGAVPVLGQAVHLP